VLRYAAAAPMDRASPAPSRERPVRERFGHRFDGLEVVLAGTESHPELADSIGLRYGAAGGDVDLEQLVRFQQALHPIEVQGFADAYTRPPARLVTHRGPEQHVGPFPADVVEGTGGVNGVEKVVVIHVVAGDGQRQQ